jgi:hypothetical protein
MRNVKLVSCSIFIDIKPFFCGTSLLTVRVDDLSRKLSSELYPRSKAPFAY